MLSATSVGVLMLCVTATGVTAGRHITTEMLNGHVRGLIEDVGGVDVAKYLGIPYAEPPVGELRFRKPVPAKPWHPTTLDALSFASPCAQANGSFPPSPWLVKRDQVSEDCLYLNVWSPLGRPRPLGVLFWIHGGGYRTGTASQVLYDGKALAAVGDIVVVSINYRVGSLGFLYTGPGSSSGNYALWDQHLGLLWVRDNIARFGGRPWPGDRNAVGHDYADRIARYVGCLDESKPSSKTNPEQVVECLRSAPVDKIIDAEDTQFHKEIVTFTPSHGDDYLPLPEVDAISRGLFIPLESILAGERRQEEGGVFLYFRVPSVINCTSAPELTKQEVVDILTHKYFGFLPEETRSMLIDEYLRRVPGVSDYSGNLNALMDILGDFLAFCPTRFYAEAFAKTNRPVYFYMYDYRYERGFWPSWMGSTHYADLQFTFGMPFRFPERYSNADREHSKTCMQVIGSYVNTGNPTLPGSGEWPAFTKEQPLHVFMRASNASIGSDFHGEGCNAYRKVYRMLGLPVP
ncbi:hypothetical protein MTO96_049145 [Rhipicephalus appendiculatus]